MKKLCALIAMALVIMTQGCGSSNKSGDELSGDLTLSGAFALYPMAQQWGEEFMKLNPKVRIDISAGGAGKGMTDVLSGLVNIGMVSREISPEEKAKGAFGIPVTRDAVVAIINADNPMLQVIMNKGLTKEQFKGIFITGTIKTWGELTGDKTNKDKINVYTRADACGAADVWAKYLGGKQENLQGTGVQGDPGVTEAVKNDKLGIGFNNICYAYDAKTKIVNTGIKVVPIDINADKFLSDEETFYVNKDQILKAISENRYPSPPARDLYFVTKGKPTDPLLVAFLNWVLTDGQKLVNTAGYIPLPKAKIDAALNSLK